MSDYTGLGNTGESLLAKRNEQGDAVFITRPRNQGDIRTNIVVSKTRTGVPIIQAMQGRSVDMRRTIDYRGVEVLASTEYIQDTDWGLVVKIDRSEALAPALRVEILILIVSVIFSALAFFLAPFISSQITNPISELTGIARELSRGNHLVRANIIPKDEIGDLATAFNRMVDNIESANTKLVQAKLLSDIGLFASFIGHELRNPLAVITIAMANIKKNVDLSSVGRSVENIEKKLAESGQIINNLLSFSRIKDSKPEPVLVYDLILECLDLLRERADKPGVRIHHTLDPIRETKVDLDRVQMGEVFHNILSNALDAVGKGGLIEVEGRHAGGMLEIIIRDSGPGIDPKHREKLFEPFFTTKVKGTGLGLAVSLRIVNLHQGSIRVKSEPGKGTEFTVVIPFRNSGV
jgi:two-component system NtrC family sensor kinase